jgi:Transposase DNA-binding
MDTLLEDFGTRNFGTAQLGDRRRTKRLVRIADRIAAHPRGSLPEKMQSPADLHALYRLMNHPRTTHEAVLDPPYQQTRARMAAGVEVVLIIHDATELNLTGKRSLHPDLGQLSCGGTARGYVCHNSLAITAQGEPLGLANQILHRRRRRPKNEPRAKGRRARHRESRLWKRGRQAIGPRPADRIWVDSCDRGGDAFEFLDYEHHSGGLYVVRSRSDRRCFVGHAPGGAAGKLHGHLRGLAAQGTRPLEVLPSPKQPGRQTTVAVVWTAVRLRPPPPGQARGQHGQEPLAVWALRVWEVSPPPKIEPLEWLLLSHVPVRSLEQAWERVDWYEWRWPVAEEYHKAQKTGGAVEGPQFTTVQALRPTIGVLSVVAWLRLRLQWLSRQEPTAAEPAVWHVPRAWVAWLSRWRLGREELGWTVREFLLALARLGGTRTARAMAHPAGRSCGRAG